MKYRSTYFFTDVVPNWNDREWKQNFRISHMHHIPFFMPRVTAISFKKQHCVGVATTGTESRCVSVEAWNYNIEQLSICLD